MRRYNSIIEMYLERIKYLAFILAVVCMIALNGCCVNNGKNARTFLYAVACGIMGYSASCACKK